MNEEAMYEWIDDEKEKKVVNRKRKEKGDFGESGWCIQGRAKRKM